MESIFTILSRKREADFAKIIDIGSIAEKCSTKFIFLSYFLNVLLLRSSSCTISPEKGNHVFLHYCINKVLNAQDSKVVYMYLSLDEKLCLLC